jgi:segregation and condensation protein A
MAEQAFSTRVNHYIKTEQFEGPLDMLLDLVEKRKLFINDFALAQVADEYIARIRRFDSFPVSDVANFLLVASALVLIKSRSILPQISLTEEENQSIDDLKRRLALLELFRDVSGHVKKQYGKTVLFPRENRPKSVIVFAPDARITPAAMQAFANDVVLAFPKPIELPKVSVKKIISIEEMLERLAERIKVALRMSFSEFTNYDRSKPIPKEERVMIVISFLAMLEMVKQGVLIVTQHENYGDIVMENLELTTPTYI